MKIGIIENESVDALVEISEHFKGYQVLIGNRLGFVSRDGKCNTYKIK